MEVQRSRVHVHLCSVGEEGEVELLASVRGSIHFGQHSVLIIIIIIIIITRPWPAFGQQGLVGSSGGYTYHGYTSHASPRACGARLGQIVHKLVELCKSSNALTFQPFLKVSGNRGNDKTP